MATRSHKKSNVPPKNNSNPSSKRVENSWIIIARDALLDNDNFVIVTLPHPGLGTPTKYCLDSANKKIFEVVTYNEPYRSWFIGDAVKSDSSLLMMTPMNALFLVLPKLREQCINRAVPLEDLLSDKGFDKIMNYVKNMNLIGDLKGPTDIKAYKYNEEKTLAWLEERVRKLATVLRDKNVHVTSGSVSATFVASNISNNDVDDEFYLKYAHGMVSEYLQDEVAVSLEKRFNFKPELIESIGKKRKSEAEIENKNKKIKNEAEDSKENGFNISSQSFSEDRKQKPLSTKEKARQKAASGTKTISSFFVKK